MCPCPTRDFNMLFITFCYIHSVDLKRTKYMGSTLAVPSAYKFESSFGLAESIISCLAAAAVASSDAAPVTASVALRSTQLCFACDW